MCYTKYRYLLYHYNGIKDTCTWYSVNDYDHMSHNVTIFTDFIFAKHTCTSTNLSRNKKWYCKHRMMFP